MERIVLLRRDEGVASTGEWRFCNWLVTVKRRLLVFSAKYRGDSNAKTNYLRLGTMISDDGGTSWREGRVADLSAAMPLTGFMQLKDGLLALFGQARLDRMVKTDRPKDDQGVWMSVSRDDGETWSPMCIVAQAAARNLCEPFCLRSPDGKTLALVMRENRHRDCSMMCFSSDEGRTWTKPALTAQELTGDRHEGIMLDDGRYLICITAFRVVRNAPSTRRRRKTDSGRFGYCARRPRDSDTIRRRTRT